MPPVQKAASEGHRNRKTELKRAKGEISCAECRRLKVKCDKAIPCNSCVRRGCQTICPNGSLATGQGTRFILADTDTLHRRLEEMSKRIRQLEDALQIAHAAMSNDQHPLLSEDLLRIKTGVASPSKKGREDDAGSDELDKDIMNSFGNLTVSERAGAGGSFLVHDINRSVLARLEPDSPTAAHRPALPFDITLLSRNFPFAPLHLQTRAMQEAIEDQLPTYERASALCECYIQNISWWIRPVARDQLMEELVPAAYKKRRGYDGGGAEGHGKGGAEAKGIPQLHAAMDPHDLAVLLMVFALGAVGDFTLEPNNDEAELYLRLSRAALCLKPVLDFASLSAVQAICLMGAYDLFSCRKRSLETMWETLSFAMSLAAGVGLHRDPTHWKFEPKIVQRRRVVFWELRILDTWKCLGSGRPASIYKNDIDCELPIDTDATFDEEGKEVPSFWRWKYVLLRDLIGEISQKLCSAKPLKYSEILELDHKVREFGTRQLSKQIAMSIGQDGYAEPGGVRAYLQRYMQNLMEDMVLQILHRNFFARAILENPKDPMRSQFAPSFIAAYNSASSLLRVIREHFEVNPHVMRRYWSVWAHSLSACVVLGSVAARVPTSALAPHAFSEFVASLDVFERAQAHPAVQSGLPVLKRLQKRAYIALLGAGVDVTSVMQKAAPPPPAKTDGGRGEGFRVLDGTCMSDSISAAKDLAAARPYPLDASDSFPQSQSTQFAPGSEDGIHGATAELHTDTDTDQVAYFPPATLAETSSGSQVYTGFANTVKATIGAGNGGGFMGFVASDAGVSAAPLDGHVRPLPAGIDRSAHTHAHTRAQPASTSTASSSTESSPWPFAPAPFFTPYDASGAPGVEGGLGGGQPEGAQYGGLGGYASIFDLQEPDFAALMELDEYGYSHGGEGEGDGAGAGAGGAAPAMEFDAALEAFFDQTLPGVAEGGLGQPGG